MERFNLPYIHLHSNIKAASLKNKRVFTCCFLGIDLFLQPGSVSRKIPLLPRGLWSENRPVSPQAALQSCSLHRQGSCSWGLLPEFQQSLLHCWEVLAFALETENTQLFVLSLQSFASFFFFPFSKYYCILSYLNKLIYYCCFV